MSVNKVILLGNITRDAEIRTVGQAQVASFGLATSERFKKSDGTVGESTEFHNIELWNNSGVHPYLKKGTPLYVEGAIKTDKWTDQQGNERSVMKIRAFTVQLVGARQQGQQATSAPQPSQFTQPTYSRPPQPQVYQQPTPVSQPLPQNEAYRPPYGAVAQPPQPPMAQQLDPGNYPGDLPF